VTEDVRVAVVDDEPLVRAGLRVVLDAEPDIAVVGEAEDGAGVPQLVTDTRPDVVLMDVRMPRVDGIAATRAVVDRAGGPVPRVVVLTTFENDDHVLDALQAGAQGFLLKRARPEEIAQAVRTVAQGDSLLFPDAVRRLAAGRPPSGDALVSARLTEREGEVLRLMADGMSNAEIAGELYLSEGTVKTYVTRTLNKLRLRSRVQVVVAAFDAGLVRPGEHRLA